MLAVVNELAPHDPGTYTAEGKEMIDLRLVLHFCFQVHSEIQIMQQVNHEIIDYICLVTFTQRVHVDRMLGEQQTDPL